MIQSDHMLGFAKGPMKYDIGGYYTREFGGFMDRGPGTTSRVSMQINGESYFENEVIFERLEQRAAHVELRGKTLLGEVRKALTPKKIF